MKKDYNTILLEEIRDQNKAILEGLREVPKRVEFNELKQDVAEVKQSVKTIEAAVKATNRDLAAFDQRVTRLEAA